MKHFALAAALLVVSPAAIPAAPPGVEEIHVLRSIREQQAPSTWCSTQRAGFTPFPVDAERFFSFWSTSSRAADGRIVDAKVARAAELHACFGATEERARQNFFGEFKWNAMVFRGTGQCVAVMTDFPEPGLYPVHCHLVLSGLPAPYVGGLLTTNTLTTRTAFGADSEPPGYTQASIATIRLWRAR